MSLYREMRQLEAKLFPNDTIVVSEARLNGLLMLPYEAVKLKRGSDGHLDGVVISVFLDAIAEEWVLATSDACTIYDLPESHFQRLQSKSNALWIDLVSGVSKSGKYWAVKQAVYQIRSMSADARVYSFSITSEGRKLARKLGLRQVGSSSLWKGVFYEKN